MDKINTDIPVFPLNGAILFPGTNLPLNIFEKRYIDMIDYALSNEKTIGMIQMIENNKDLYKIGCLGKITSFVETDDGRYLVNLSGLNYFKIIKEISTKNKFRKFKVEYSESENSKLDLLDEKLFSKSLLLDKFKLFFKNLERNINFDSIKDIESTELIKMMAMVCPFTVTEKQLLLESMNINLLAKNLVSLFDFYINENKSSKSVN